MRGKIILDTRNLLDKEKVTKTGFKYEGVGRQKNIVEKNKEQIWKNPRN
jgi:hypothetical protein